MVDAERHASGAGHTVQTHACPKAYAVARRLQAFVRPSAATPPHIQKELPPALPWEATHRDTPWTRPHPRPVAEGEQCRAGRGAGGPGVFAVLGLLCLGCPLSWRALSWGCSCLGVS